MESAFHTQLQPCGYTGEIHYDTLSEGHFYALYLRLLWHESIVVIAYLSVSYLVVRFAIVLR